MASVTFQQPTDMTELPTTHTGFNASGTHATILDELGYAFGSCVGTFAFDSGANFVSANVQTAEFDNLDEDMIGNFLITNITIGSTQPIVDALENSNILALSAALLAGSDKMTGSAGADWMTGYAGSDLMHGAAGNDTVDGGPGNDTLFGDAGADAVAGSSGRDILVGGLGPDLLYADAELVGNDGIRDIIRYTRLADSGITSATRDQIFGAFGSSAAADRIDLSPLDADPAMPGNQAFHVVSAFTAAHGEVRLVTSGGNTIIQVDGDEDPAIDMTILVAGAHIHALDLIL